MTARWTDRKVKAALYHHFTPRYAVLTEITTADPAAEVYSLARAEAETAAREQGLPWSEVAGALPYPPAWTRRVDVLLVGRDERIAVEVKVTRADFLADVRDPAKQAAWRALAHRHAYAVPTGLVSPDEVPPGSGLLAVTDEGWPRATWTRRAPKGNEPEPLPDSVLRAIMVRCARAEAVAKGLDRPGDDCDPGELRARIDRLTADLDAAYGREQAARDRADAWRRAYAAHGDPPCGTCGLPLRPKWSARLGERWEHRDPVAELTCRPLREAADAARHPEAVDAGRYRAWAGPPEPADALPQGDAQPVTQEDRA